MTTLATIDELLDQYGEIIVTLESGREIELHKHDWESRTVGKQDKVFIEKKRDEYNGILFNTGRIESIEYHS